MFTLTDELKEDLMMSTLDASSETVSQILISILTYIGALAGHSTERHAMCALTLHINHLWITEEVWLLYKYFSSTAWRLTLY